MANRTFTLTVTKIVGSVKQPDTAKTVTIRDLAGSIIATAIENPANSGQYQATFAEVAKYGWWYVDGIQKDAYSNNSPFWLGAYNSVSANAISSNSIVASTLTATTISANTYSGGNLAKTDQSNIFTVSPQTITQTGGAAIKFVEQDSGDTFIIGQNSSGQFIVGIGSTLATAPKIVIDANGNVQIASSLSALTVSAGTFVGDGSKLTGITGTGGSGGGVPYTGATANVNLGSYSLTASSLSSSGITGSTVSATLLLAGNFQAITASLNSKISGLETATGNLTTKVSGLESATGNLQTQVGSLWNSKVPYTGASANVNLGSYNLTASSVSANTYNGGNLAKLDVANTFTQSPQTISKTGGGTIKFVEQDSGDTFIIGNDGSGNFIVGTGSTLATSPIISSNTNGIVVFSHSISSGNVTGSTISATLLLAGNFQSITASQGTRLTGLETATGNLNNHLTGTDSGTGALQTQVGSLWNSKVPYAGATANVSLDSYGLTGNSIAAISGAAGVIDLVKIFGNANSGGTTGRLLFICGRNAEGGVSNDYTPVGAIGGALYSNNFDSYSGGLIFYTSSMVSDPVEVMRLAPDGKVGIGTKYPIANLHVVGSISADSISSNTITSTTISAMTITATAISADRMELGDYQGGTVGSAVSGLNRQLALGGAYNLTYNLTGVKLWIGDYSNDGELIYPIYVEDENNLVDFWIKNRQSSALLPSMFFAGSLTSNSVSASSAFFGNNVGIGTATPNTSLQVYSMTSAQQGINVTSSAVTLMLHAASAGVVYIGSLSNHRVDFLVANSVKATVQTTGNFGIGTAAPSNKLHVYESTAADVQCMVQAISSTNAAYISAQSGHSSWGGFNLNFGGTTNRTFLGNRGGTVGNFSVYQYKSTSAYVADLTVTIDGNVGIGTAAPSAHLHVTGSISAQSLTATGSVSAQNLSATNLKIGTIYFNDGTSLTSAVSGGTGTVGGSGVPYTGATANVDLGAYSLSAQTITANSSSAAIINKYGAVQPYKTYVGILTQVGSSIPTSKICQNTFTANPTFSRVSAGYYRCVLSGNWTSNKTYFNMPGWSPVNWGVYGINRIDANTIEIKSSTTGYISADGLLLDTPIEIRVYE